MSNMLSLMEENRYYAELFANATMEMVKVKLHRCIVTV